MMHELEEFGVTHMLGMNAFWMLRHAYENWQRKEYWKYRQAEQTQEEMLRTADRPGVRVWGYGGAMRHSLAAAVIQYQASMEAILSNAVSRSDSVAAVANGNGFRSDWRNALVEVDESTKEFDAYHDHFYKELRIPLTHLHGDTQAKLERINAMDFPDVFVGMRYGWWAHIRLLAGIELAAGPIQDNWEHICQGADVPPNLFPERHPDRLPDV